MKWFKHLTNSRNDPDISDSFDRFGADGPYIFWVTLEIFAQEFGGDDTVRLSKKYLERQTSYPFERLAEIYEFFQSEERKKPRIFVTTEENHVVIRIPKFNEVADDYTRKRYRKSVAESAGVRTLSEQSPEKVLIEGEGEKEKEKEKEEEKEKGKDYVDQLEKKLKTTEKQLHELQGTHDDIPFKEIIAHLNEKTGRKYPATAQSSKRTIRARWAEGARLDDFKQCIDNMCIKWLADPKMQEYLRPVTLFQAEKFWGYVGNKPEASKGGYRGTGLAI